MRPLLQDYFGLVKEPLAWAINIICLGLLVVGTGSCKHGKCEPGPSSSASKDSHNAGENCMRCHLPDGEGEICWNVAGTIYNASGQLPMSGVQVALFTAPLGSGGLRQTLQSDRTGNIYTSSSVDFGSGLFPALIHGGDTAFMTESIRDGACNRCHGRSTERVRVH